MSRPAIQIRLDAREFHIGDQVSGTVVMDSDKRARSSCVELCYGNRYNVPGDVGRFGFNLLHTGEGSSYDSAIDVIVADRAELPTDPGEHRIELTIPTDAPPSVHDEDIARGVSNGFAEVNRDLVAWQVVVRLNRKRREDLAVPKGISVRSRSRQCEEWAGRRPVSRHPECLINVACENRLVRAGEPLSGTLALTPGQPISARGVRAQLERRRFDHTGSVPLSYDPRRQLPFGLASPENPGAFGGCVTELSGPCELVAGQTQSFPFELIVPQDAPPSFLAAHNELHWFVVGVVDLKRKQDYTGEMEIVVYTGEPGGTPLQPPAELRLELPDDTDVSVEVVAMPRPDKKPDALGNFNVWRAIQKAGLNPYEVKDDLAHPPTRIGTLKAVRARALVNQIKAEGGDARLVEPGT